MKEANKYRDVDEVVIAEEDGCTMLCEIDSENTVLTGTTVYRISNSEKTEEYDLIEEKFGICFIYDDTEIDVDFYCVPLIDFFAFDGDGYYGTVNGFTDNDSENEICYVNKDGKAFIAAKNLSDFTASLLGGAFDKSKIKASSDIAIFKSEKEARKSVPFMQ